jgi:hypothetical protein
MNMDTDHAGQPQIFQTSPVSVFDCPASFSVLAVAPPIEDNEFAARLLSLARGLRVNGHHLRLVTAAAPAIRELRVLTVAHGPLHAPTGAGYIGAATTIGSYSKAIYQALSTERTHIIHLLPGVSMPVAHATSLAAFTYALRHPCLPEPALVTTFADSANDGGHHVLTYTRRQLRLFGDGLIVFTSRERNALVAAIRDQRLHERVHLIGAERNLAQATVEVYQLAWARRQSVNRQALLPIEM